MKRLISSFLVGVGIAVLLVAIWKTQFASGAKLAAFERTPEGIMGTSCRLVVVMDFRQGEEAQKIFDKAEFQLRYIESLASNWIKESEISQLNAAGIGEFQLSQVNWDIVNAAYHGFVSTQGAFNATCQPLIEVWKNAGLLKELPTTDALVAARKISSWELLTLDAENRSVFKKESTVRVDLGGIAKGYAIDEALKAMVEQGVTGAMVEVGGDIRVYGTSARDGGTWKIEIQDPHRAGVMSSFELEGGMAVCTSGNYARFVEIEGVRYSHILNPVTGYPTASVPSVTVVATTAMQSDIWATALSVLGAAALELLPQGVEAKIIEGATNDSEQVVQTPGFPE